MTYFTCNIDCSALHIYCAIYAVVRAQLETNSKRPTLEVTDPLLQLRPLRLDVPGQNVSECYYCCSPQAP